MRHLTPTRPRRVGVGAIMATGALLAGMLASAPAQAAGSNIVANPGFESGLTGWAATGGTLTLSNDAASGVNSGSLSNRTAFYHGIKGSLTEPLVHDAAYRVTAKVKFTSTNATEPFGFAFCPASGACVAAANAIKQVAKDAWSTYTLDFTPNQSSNYQPEFAGTTFQYFQFETPWSSTVPFLVDDVSIERLDPPAEVGQLSVENIQGKPVGDHNPVVAHKFGADPHHLIWNGRLYIYSTSDDQQYRTATKQANGLPVTAGGYDRITHLNVWSTDDMVNWVDHGEVPVAKVGGVATWAGNSWAPAAVSADLNGDGTEEVYLYFCNGGAGTGVIVGGSPLGPWTDPNGKMVISQNNPIAFPSDMWLFDPEIFVDDDKQPYLYFGGNWDFAQDPYHPKSTRVVKLDPKDYTKLADPTGAGITVIDGPGMFEASSMFKKDGKYYYSYSSNFAIGDATYDAKKIEGQAYPGGGQIAYMMSDDPMTLTRDEFVGTAFANHDKWFPGSGGNNHSDMFTYKGHDYFTYHTQVVGVEWGKALDSGKTVNYRSVHIDELKFNADGTIQEVVGTRAGVDQLQNFDPYRTFEAETLAWQLGLHVQETAAASIEFPEHNGSGNTALIDIDNGDFAGISQVDFGDGAATVSALVKPLAAGGSIEVRMDSEVGPVVGTIPVTSAVGEWATASTTVTGASGVHDLFFVFKGVAGQRLMEVDNWTFTGADVPVVTPTPSVPAPVTATVTATETVTATATVTAPAQTVTATSTVTAAPVTSTVTATPPTVTNTATVTSTATVTATPPTVTRTATATSTSTVTAPAQTVTATATVTTDPVTSTVTATPPTVTETETVTSTATVTVTADAPTKTVTAPPATTTVTVTPKASVPPKGDLYSTPGFHVVNGRNWYTQCEPYSMTQRCRTDIWSTQISYVNGKYVWDTGWHFNSLTYLPATKAQWGSNPLANDGAWTAADGRQWRTECNTATTGANACRSYIRTNYIAASQGTSGWTYRMVDGWVLNNIVRFTA